MEFRWKKLGRTFIPQDVPDRVWLKNYAQCPGTLIFDDFVRVYFSCRPFHNEDGTCVSYSAYVDFERGDLTKIIGVSKKPILELGGLGEFDEFGTYPASVIRNDNEIRAYYAGWTRCSSVRFNVAIGLAFSSDSGKTFQKAGNGPVLSYSLDEPFIIGSHKIRYFNDMWHMFYIAGRKWKIMDGRTEPVYKIRSAISINGVDWVKYGKDLIENRLEDDEVQSGADVIYLDGKYHMFFCYRHSGHHPGKEMGLRIGYASSTDLYNWERDDSKAGIDISDSGWDSEMVRYPHVFELDGNIYMLYNGNEFGKYGFGLAKLDV